MTTKDPWILLALVGLLAGCGQKGPLVLPDQQHPHKTLKFPAAPAASAPGAATPKTPGETGATGTVRAPEPAAGAPPAASPEADAADPSPSDGTAPP